MVEMENELCFVCVEDQVAGEWEVLQFFDRNLRAILKALRNVDIYSNMFRMVVCAAQCLFFSF